MISANELRVGNRFNRELKSQRGLEYDPNFILTEEFMGKLFGGDISIALQDLFPIPLTEEILVKCGFEEVYKSSFHSVYYVKDFSYYFWYANKRQYALFNGAEINCNYIHQLQNLYFALTSKELGVNL